MYTLRMASQRHEQMGRAYDLVELIWEGGQPPDPDWKKLAEWASELAVLAERLDR
jgi:hypothetical protein